jgi:hypothetical protein
MINEHEGRIVFRSPAFGASTGHVHPGHGRMRVGFSEYSRNW